MMKWFTKKEQPEQETERTAVLTRKIHILKETEHYVLLAPPNVATKEADFLDELEFVRASGFRPLFPIAGVLCSQDSEGIVCEKLESPR